MGLIRKNVMESPFICLNLMGYCGLALGIEEGVWGFGGLRGF